MDRCKPQHNPHDKRPPLQFKRGTAKAFRLANPLLLSGQPAFEIDTKRLKIGDGKTRYLALPYVGGERDGKDGKSAYQLWRENGNSGSVEDFLESLIGPAGKSTYELWLSLGNEGTIVDFMDTLQGAKGDRGKSAYELWLEQGNEGSIAEFIDSLKGESAYELWLSLGNEGTVADFIDSLKGESAYELWKEVTGNTEATEEEYIASTMTTTWGTF